MVARKKCFFCGDTTAKITGEHIWSAWIGRLFDQSAYEWRVVDPESGAVKTFGKKAIDLKVNDICKACNEGWMSHLEERAKRAFSDMIRDKIELSLLPSGVSTLAAFAFKSALIANCINARREPFFTTAARLRFKNSLQIPDGVQMWLAAYAGGGARSGLFNGKVFETNAPIMMNLPHFVGA